jgi:putative oxidoreductase
MKRENIWYLWTQENREIAIEMLRIYLGVALVIKGWQFITNPQQAAEYMQMVHLPFFEFLSIHIVAMVHIAGGFLLAIGLLSRIAALVQVPILFGAIFFVHFQQGLFTKEQNLELVILVFFLLLVFVVYGGGRLSVDYVLERHHKKNSQ